MTDTSDHRRCLLLTLMRLWNCIIKSATLPPERSNLNFSEVLGKHPSAIAVFGEWQLWASETQEGSGHARRRRCGWEAWGEGENKQQQASIFRKQALRKYTKSKMQKCEDTEGFPSANPKLTGDGEEHGNVSWLNASLQAATSQPNNTRRKRKHRYPTSPRAMLGLMETK